MVVERRKRLADGTLGPLEPIGGGLSLVEENRVLKAQVKSLESQTQFHEDLLQELALKVYE